MDAFADAPPPQDGARDGSPPDGVAWPMEGCVPREACPDGSICPREPEGAPVDPAAPPSAPVITEARAWVGGNVVRVRARGYDINGDAAHVAFWSLGANGEPYSGAHGIDHREAVARQGRSFVGSTSAQLMGPRVRVWVTDASGMQSQPVDLTPEPQPELPLDAPCDPAQVSDRCVAGALCRGLARDAAPRCVRGTAPTVVSAQWLANVPDGLGRLEVAVSDVDRDVMQVHLTDGGGALVAEGFVAPADGPWCGAQGGVSLSLTRDLRDLRLDARSLFVVAIDRQGLRSGAFPVTTVRAPTVGQGAACDVRGLRDRCDRAAGHACASGRCAPEPLDCPAAWSAVDLLQHPAAGEPGAWSFTGSTVGAPRIASLVGLHDALIVRAHRFVAPRAGRWRVTLDAQRMGRLVGRRWCARPEEANHRFFADPGAEAVARADTTLDAGEALTLLVHGGYQRTLASYTLRVAPVPTP